MPVAQPTAANCHGRYHSVFLAEGYEAIDDLVILAEAGKGNHSAPLTSLLDVSQANEVLQQEDAAVCARCDSSEHPAGGPC